MKISSTPGFSLRWTPVKADVSAAGDVGYTVGTYEASMNGATEKGKYVVVWKKQPDGTWKAAEDIFNADATGAPPSKPVMLAASGLTWGDPPPVLPAGAKMAVVSGDPSKPELFAVRLQMPAGYKIAPHWHPTDENVTVLSGTFGLGMGETFGAVKDLPAGSYAVLPAAMRHFAKAVTATTVQVDGMGPFVVNYVNAADDPSKKK
jgi:quercetin dioxygenase-like cupin family protein